MEFQLQLKKLACSNPINVLNLRKIGVTFTHGKKVSLVDTLPVLKMYTLEDLINLSVEQGPLTVRVEHGKNFIYIEN